MATPVDDTSISPSSYPATALDNLGAYDFPAIMSGGVSGKTENDLESMIVNVTREYPFDYATVMFGYIMPFVLVLTLITNTLVVMVLAQRHMRTPTNIVLFTMAIVDLMTLLSPSPWYFYIYTLGYHDKFLYPPIACYAHHFMTDVIPVFFHTSSIWLALLLAGQRYIYVCHPSLASTWCTVPRVRKAIIIILVIAFLHQVTRFFDNKFESVTIQYNQVQHKACKNEVSKWVESIDIGAYYITYYTFRIVFVFIIPCVALITLNCLLFSALKRAENKRCELLKTKFKSVGGNRSSVAGLDGRQSSYVGNSVIKNEPSNSINTNAGPSSSLSCPTKRKVSSPPIKLNRDDTKALDVEEEYSRKSKRKFSISSSFRMRRLTGGIGETNNLNEDRLFPRVDSSGTQQLDNKSTNKKVNSDKIIKNTTPRSEEQSNLSDEGSDHSEGEQETRRSLLHNSFSRNRCGIREHGKQKSRESNESYSFVSNQSKGRDENQSKSKTSIDEREDDYTCPGCPVCEEQQLDDLKWCRRCLASSANDGVTTADNHHHQPVSQCSSLIGGVTNTTTNDEVSSCGHTHNISSSMNVAHDGTLDGIESASIREDDEGPFNNDRESTSLHHHNNNNNNNNNNLNLNMNQNQTNNINNSNIENGKRVRRNRKSVSADGGTKIDIDLMKSNSIDSRLVCGCPISPDRKTLYHCTRSNYSRRDGCQECCSASKCRKRSKSRGANEDQSTKLRSPIHKCIASCSSSDPCIKCNNQTQDNSGCKSASIREAEVEISNEKTISQSNSDYYGDRCAAECNDDPNKQQSNVDIYLDGNAAATTTTTTTTLHSTQANSIASLLQAQTNRQKQSPQLQSNQETHTKSPSFVSTMGRGSRATLIGNSNSMNPPALVVTGGNPTASLRTMDSNRTTLMLIVVVSVFLIVEVPVAIVTILHVVLNSFDAFQDVEFSAYLNYIKLFTNFFIMISYSVNFTIYCSMSKKFRETFRDLFMCGKQARRKRAAGLLYQQTQHSQYINNNNTNINNSTNMNHLQNHESERSNNNLNNTLIASATQINETTNTNSQSVSALRYTPYRTRASSQQQECEL